MDANDRKLLKKMVDRDVARATKVLTAQQSAEVEAEAGSRTPRQLPKAVAKLLAMYNKHVAAVSALSQQLHDQGWDMPRELTLRNWNGQANVPTLDKLSVTAEARSAIAAKVAVFYRPKRQQIEDAQSEALLNIIAGDLPGMRKELEKLTQALAKIVGVKTLRTVLDE